MKYKTTLFALLASASAPARADSSIGHMPGGVVQAQPGDYFVGYRAGVDYDLVLGTAATHAATDFLTPPSTLGGDLTGTAGNATVARIGGLAPAAVATSGAYGD